MSDHDPQESPDDELQFDEAEYEGAAPPSLSCAACKREIDSVYYEINGQTLCENCRRGIEAGLTGGSRIARFLRATVYGIGAGAIGFAIYFAVLKIANMQVGLISILVGFMVGKAVGKGSQHRGGWFYQLLAVFLTYTAIGASFCAYELPPLIASMDEAKAKRAAAPAAPGAQPAAAGRPGRSVPELILLGLASVFLTYALPVMKGIESPISILIVGFALWEAWKFNARRQIVFNGPFRVGDSGESTRQGMPTHA